MAFHHEAKHQTTNSIIEITSDHAEDNTTVHSSSGDRTSYLSQGPVARRQKSKFSWTTEILCAVLSCASIGAIVVLLRHYDGKSLSTWKLNAGSGSGSVYLSLNFVVSILSTFAKSTSAVVLSSCLSQLKWNWFSSSQRPLGDFQVFEHASRGPKGSLELLWRTKAMRLASIGALLTIMSLALDPFSQLLITYPGSSYQIPNGAGTIAHAQRFVQGDEVLDMGSSVDASGDFHPNTTTSPYSDIVGGVSNAFGSPDTRREPNYECANGNCTWPTYVSLAICSSCFDITSYLVESTVTGYLCGLDGNMGLYKSTDPGKQFSLEPYIPLSFVNGACNDTTGMDVRVSASPNETINFRDSQTLLFSAAFLMVDATLGNSRSTDTQSSRTNPTAIECGLQLCSNTYSSMVENGRFSETVLSSNSKRVRESWRNMPGVETSNNITGSSHLFRPQDDSWNPPFSNVYTPRQDFQIELSEEQRNMANISAFNISQASIDSTIDYLISLIPNNDPNDTTSMQVPAVFNERGCVRYSSLSVQALYSAPSINSTFNSLATDMSVAIRNAGNITTKGSQMEASDYFLPPITGVSNEYRIVIRIRWPFIAVPVAICVLSTLYLIASIVQTVRLDVPAWKDDVLAGLFWGMDQEAIRVVKADWSANGVDGTRKMAVMFKGDKAASELGKAHLY